jgi:hypothetical protein
MAGGGVSDASAWEEVLCAYAEELWAWSIDAERSSPRDSRRVKRARELARDLQVASGLYDVVPWERVQLLLDAAHELLESRSLALPLLLGPEVEDLEWAPATNQTARQLASLVGDDEEETTSPGVPAEVFRRYLASLST